METTNTAQYTEGHIEGWRLASEWVGFVIPGHVLRAATAARTEAWENGFCDALEEAAEVFEN